VPDGTSPAPSAPTPPPSAEVELHEVGEGIAAAMAAIQQELTRYPNSLGAFLVDEVDLDIPIRFRVDTLGQVLATVVNSDEPSAAVGRLRLRLRPVLGAVLPPPVTSDQSLASLGALPPEDLAKLEAQRIFSVDDLLRVTRTASGRSGVDQLDLATRVDSLLGRAEIIASPALPAPVAETLVQIGVDSPAEFVDRDPAQVAVELSKQLNQPVTAEDVAIWQQEVKLGLEVPLPSSRPPTEGAAV
jgi:hypothetical protein